MSTSNSISYLLSFHVGKDSPLLNKINHFCDCQSDLFELGKFKVKNVIITWNNLYTSGANSGFIFHIVFHTVLHLTEMPWNFWRTHKKCEGLQITNNVFYSNKNLETIWLLQVTLLSELHIAPDWINIKQHCDIHDK